MGEDLTSSLAVPTDLSRFDNILVTGPQRSGTTIIARMLSADLGYRYVDETNAAFDNSWGKLLRGLRYYRHSVIQCPAQAWRIQALPRSSKTLVVWVNRPREEIIASQDRIGWSVEFEHEELYHYIHRWGASPDQRVVDVKNDVWENGQKGLLRVPFIEMDYHSDYVQQHSQYLPPPARKQFASKQTFAGQQFIEELVAP